MKICVYSASSGQLATAYVEGARQLGRLMAAGGHELINGAGRTGLMGAATEGILQAGGRAVGVIPQFMVDRGWHHPGMSQLIITPDMHTRKQTMARLSEACIALPGGVGTLEELLELITWKQLGLYDRPIVILNLCGYFRPLLQMLEQAAAQQFMRPEHARLWCEARTPAEALSLCETTPRWNKALGKFAAL